MKKKLLASVLILLFSGVAVAFWINRGSSIPNEMFSAGTENTKSSSVTQAQTETLMASENTKFNKLIQTQKVQSGTFKVSAESIHKNLQIFLLQSMAEIHGERYVTLDDALEAKLITVRETGNVNELKIDNKSSSYIYLNSGDIVRGGKQDRTIQNDMVIGPHMKNIDLASFCVEHDRWQSRGDENVQHFSSSKNSLSSKELKVAAKLSKNQSEVWDKVDKYQNKATENISLNYSNADMGTYDVKSKVSASSLDLTLENKELQIIKEEYRQTIMKNLKNQTNTIGIACFINGKLSSIDIFNNQVLFNDMFDKLLDAAIAEAISENAVKKYVPADTSSVYTCIRKEFRLLSSDEVNTLTRFSTYKTTGHIMQFLTEDKELNKWLHKNWLDTKLD